MHLLRTVIFIIVFSNLTNASEKETPVHSLNSETSIHSRNYLRILDSPGFVDKSMLIKELYDMRSCKLKIITAPPGFGKTVNSQMIKHFFEQPFDVFGTPVPQEKNIYYSKFKNLRIGIEMPQFFQKHFATYPVIYVDFQHVDGHNMTTIRDGIVKSVSSAYRHHQWLLTHMMKDAIHDAEPNSSCTFPNNVTLLQQYMSGHGIPITKEVTQFCELLAPEHTPLSDGTIHNGISILVKLLLKYCHKAPVVLIDELDKPLRVAIQRDLDTYEVRTLVEGMLVAVASTPSACPEITLLTGILGVISGPASNNVHHMEFTDNDELVTKYYGYNKDEVETLMYKYRFDESTKRELDHWYGGYTVRQKNLQLYCPLSISKYLQERKFDNYCSKVGGIQTLVHIIPIGRIYMKINQLANDEHIHFYFKGIVYMEDLLELQELSRKAGSGEKVLKDIYHYDVERHENIFFSYLLRLGYLTSTNEQDKYKLPNKDMKSELERIMDTVVFPERNFQNAVDEFWCFAGNATNTDTRKFQDALNSWASQIVIYEFRDEDVPGVHPNEEIMRYLIGSVVKKSSLREAKADGAGHEAEFIQRNFHKGRKTESPLVIVSGCVATLIGVVFDSDPDVALDQAREHEHMLEENGDVKSIKFVGVDVSDYRKIIMKCVTKNTR